VFWLIGAFLVQTDAGLLLFGLSRPTWFAEGEEYGNGKRDLETVDMGTADTFVVLSIPINVISIDEWAGQTDSMVRDSSQVLT
jgi:hypothetical protein